MNISQRNFEVVRGLKPELLWTYFVELCNIPHGSKNEEAVAEFIFKLATDRFSVTRDENNNVVVYMPATPGFEDRPSICLQGHLDMVCEKLQTSTHNFDTDPIELVRKDDKLTANGTTLGADNGIGAATMLAIMMDETIEHGPLELLFTTVEEDGFIGAAALDPNMIRSELIINLDSEELGEIYVGCAGGGRVNGNFDISYVPSNDNMLKCRIAVEGLKGGHSGLEIHLGRANAIKLLGLVLQETAPQIVSLKGGNKMNAIPREAEAIVLFPADQLDEVTTSFNQIVDKIRLQYQGIEPNLNIVFENLGLSIDERVFDPLDQDAILELIESLPHGVIRMDPKNSALVETSNNVGILAMDGEHLTITCMFRSSAESQMDKLQPEISGMIEKAGGVPEMLSRYVAWEPRFDTPLLGTAKQVHQQLFGIEPPAKTIHAGLECAVFQNMFPEKEIISFGPTLSKVHTPDESVDIASVETYWNYLLALLQAIGAPVATEA